MVELGEDDIGRFGPGEGPGIIRYQLMAAWRSAIERKTPRRMRWRVILEKKLSTALSQDPEVG